MRANNIVRVVCVAGAALAGAASATSGSATCPPAPATCGPQTLPATSEPDRDPELVPVPPLRRRHLIEPDKSIEGLEISAVPEGKTGWTIRIVNDGDGIVSVSWDESTFVASNGQTWGRLIRGETRRMDIGKSQPLSPIAPHSTLTETVFPEKLTESEMTDVEFREKARHGITAKFADEIRENMKRMNALLVGGHLYLSLTTSTGKQTWNGVVVKAPSDEAK